MSSNELNNFAKTAKNFRKENPSSHYPKEFQKTVQDLIENGYPLSQISHATGISLGTIRKWRKPDNEHAFTPAVLIDKHRASSLTIITGVHPNDLSTVLQWLQ
jgi:hypothetical protein